MPRKAILWWSNREIPVDHNCHFDEASDRSESIGTQESHSSNRVLDRAMPAPTRIAIGVSALLIAFMCHVDLCVKAEEPVRDSLPIFVGPVLPLPQIKPVGRIQRVGHGIPDTATLTGSQTFEARDSMRRIGDPAPFYYTPSDFNPFKPSGEPPIPVTAGFDRLGTYHGISSASPLLPHPQTAGAPEALPYFYNGEIVTGCGSAGITGPSLSPNDVSLK